MQVGRRWAQGEWLLYWEERLQERCGMRRNKLWWHRSGGKGWKEKGEYAEAEDRTLQLWARTVCQVFGCVGEGCALFLWWNSPLSLSSCGHLLPEGPGVGRASSKAPCSHDEKNHAVICTHWREGIKSHVMFANAAKKISKNSFTSHLICSWVNSVL